MIGVEILATEEVVVEWAIFGWDYFWLMVKLSFFISAIFGIVISIIDSKSMGVGMFLTGFIFGGVVLGTIVGFNIGEPTKYETQYKVAIDDSVSMNAFVDKYEVLDQEGKIYTVRERE